MKPVSTQLAPKTVKLISRKKSTVANLVHQYVTICLSIVNGILLVPLYLKYIDYDLYGAWLATGSIVSWLAMVDGGLNIVIRQKTAISYGASNFKDTGDSIGTGTFLTGIVSITPLLISIVIAPFLKYLFDIPKESNILLSKSLVISGISLSLVIISGAATAIQQGLQRNISVCAIYTIGSILGIVSTVWLLLNDYSVLSIPIGLVIRGLFWFIVGWGYTLYLLKYKLRVKLKICKHKIREFKSLISWTFLNKLSLEVLGQSDALLIGLIIGVEFTPIYALSKRIWDLARLFLSRIGFAFMPGLAHLYGEGDLGKFLEIAKKLLRFTGYGIAILSGLFMTLNRYFISLWVGEKFYVGFLFDFGMCLGLLTTVYILTVSNVLFAEDTIKRPSVMSSFNNIVRIILFIPLLSLGHLTGAAFSFWLSNSIFIIIYFNKKWIELLGLHMEEVCLGFFRFLKLIIYSFATSQMLKLIIGISNWNNLILVTLLSLGLTLLLYLTDNIFRNDIKSLLKR